MSVFARRRLVAVIVVLGILVLVLGPTIRRIVRDVTLPLDYAGVIRQQAAQKHLDPALIAAVIYAETKFDSRTSPAGALGLMQIEPSTAQFLANRSGATDFTIADLQHPATNIAYGSYYRRYLLDRYGGNETLALAAYNAGETNVDGWLAQAHAAGVRFSVDAVPFSETRAYVRRVEHAQLEYRTQYGL